MTLRELKQAICNAGLRGESEGFLEKSEFVGLLTSYLNDVRGQDECSVCLLPLNFAMKSILRHFANIACVKVVSLALYHATTYPARVLCAVHRCQKQPWPLE